jgi:hypothetical protein
VPPFSKVTPLLLLIVVVTDPPKLVVVTMSPDTNPLIETLQLRMLGVDVTTRLEVSVTVTFPSAYVIADVSKLDKVGDANTWTWRVTEADHTFWRADWHKKVMDPVPGTVEPVEYTYDCCKKDWKAEFTALDAVACTTSFKLAAIDPDTVDALGKLNPTALRPTGKAAVHWMEFG